MAGADLVTVKKLLERSNIGTDDAKQCARFDCPPIRVTATDAMAKMTDPAMRQSTVGWKMVRFRER